ncbi:MAG: septal ring lytic transglycosylase RlpA family protein [Nitrospinae bacterium]|nr:septal ring lytic transglycosylase RlpA family protein [Nitrospinota bacterium]
MPPSQAPAPGALKNVKPYTVMGVTYYPLAEAYGFSEEGIASWYGKDFDGKPTANGETYDMYGVSAAHKTLPLGTMVEVTRLDNGNKLAVRVNDRGPFVPDRVIDLSYGAAKILGIVGPGTARVRVVALAQGKPGADGAPAPTTPLPDFTHGEFYVQVGAFGVTANAGRVRDSLGDMSLTARLQPYTNPAGQALTRVQAGPYGDINVAREAMETLKGKGFAQSFVVAD